MNKENLTFTCLGCQVGIQPIPGMSMAPCPKCGTWQPVPTPPRPQPERRTPANGEIPIGALVCVNGINNGPPWQVVGRGENGRIVVSRQFTAGGRVVREETIDAAPHEIVAGAGQS